MNDTHLRVQNSAYGNPNPQHATKNGEIRLIIGLGTYMIRAKELVVREYKCGQSQIVVGSGCMGPALAEVDWAGYSSVFVFSQQNIWSHHGEILASILDQRSVRFDLYLIDDGERQKSLAVYESLLHYLAESGADRRSLILVLGGGVVGDLVGFVASSYMRGLPWLYVPSSLLAQQDASVGGKVAVNLGSSKNIVGHFWPPQRVILDVDLLASLPHRQQIAGYMELLKHGVFSGDSLLADIMGMPMVVDDWMTHVDVLARGVQVKIDIVKRDPYEHGPRRLLNLGHTLAHALEAQSEFGLLHGEAVGLGLVYAFLLGRTLGSTYDWAPAIEAVRCRLSHLPVVDWPIDALLDRTKGDKKAVAGDVRWIIPLKPGQVVIQSAIPTQPVRQTLVRWKEMVTSWSVTS